VLYTTGYSLTDKKMFLYLLLGVLILVLAWLAKIKYQQTYWQRIGVPVAPPMSFPLGNSPFFVARKVGKHASIPCLEQYQWAQQDPVASKLGFYGTYTFGGRALVITDVDLVNATKHNTS